MGLFDEFDFEFFATVEQGPVIQEKTGEKFKKSFPIGTFVQDTSKVLIEPINGSYYPFGHIASGAIHDDPNLMEVNVTDVNGVKDSRDIWSIRNLQKAKRVK